jgi:hypothetical protein
LDADFRVPTEKLITRLTRILLALVAVCLLVGACSSVRLGYGAMPLWLGWQIDRHLGLDAGQRELVSARLEALHRWHRQTQLPEYTAFLASVQLQLAGGAVDVDDIGRWRAQVLAAWTPIAERAAPDLAALALTLQPAQLDRLARRFERSNRELRDELLPEGVREREAARGARVLKRARFFFGDVPAREEQEIRALASELPASESDWLAEREARQQAVLAVLARIVRERPPPEVAERWCRDVLAGLWRTADPQRGAAIARSTAAGDALSAALLRRAAPAQQERLVERLRGFADDFSVLAAR